MFPLALVVSLLAGHIDYQDSVVEFLKILVGGGVEGRSQGSVSLEILDGLA